MEKLFSCECCSYTVRTDKTCFTPQAQLRWNLSLPRSTSSSSTAPLRPTRSPCSCPEGWWSLSCIRFWMGSITSMPTGCSTGIWWAAILASLLQFPFRDTHRLQHTLHRGAVFFPKATLASHKHCYPGEVEVVLWQPRVVSSHLSFSFFWFCESGVYIKKEINNQPTFCKHRINPN